MFLISLGRQKPFSKYVLHAAVFLQCNKIGIGKDRLQVHGLPDRPGFNIFRLQRIHGHVGRHAAFRCNRHTGASYWRPRRDSGGSLQLPGCRQMPLYIVCKFPVFLFMLLQVKQLASADTRYHIGHPVVKANLGMLIVPCLIPGLGGKEAGFSIASPSLETSMPPPEVVIILFPLNRKMP